MKPVASPMATFYAAIAAVGALAALVASFYGDPPRHCRYLVPVATAPGVYACSEYPRKLARP